MTDCRISAKMTLMEVFFVISIIVILITILLPVFMKSREWGKSIVCKGNLKNLGAAIHTYANDWEGRAPSYFPWTYYLMRADYLPWIKVANAAGTNPTYAKTYLPYSTYAYPDGWYYAPAAYNILACPSQKINEKYNEYVCGQLGYTTNAQKDPYHWTAGSHYAIWDYMASSSPPIIGAQAHPPLRYWKRPDRRPMLFDANGYNTYHDGNVYCKQFWARHWGRGIDVTSANISTNTYVNFGPAKMNIVFIDGHVESLSWYDIFKSSSRGYNMFYYQQNGW